MNNVSDVSGGKIKDLRELSVVLEGLKAQGKTIVHCHGVFDLIHPGHIRHLEAARAQGDVLVVTLTQDRHVNKGPDRPVFNERLRAESLAALQVVDFVAINEWPVAVDTIHLLRPNIYVKGNDYADASQDLTGKIGLEEQAILDVGGRIHFTNDPVTFSSSRLLNSYFSVLSSDVESYLKEFKGLYSANQVIEKLRDCKDMRVLVIGDAILDEYHFCSPLGMATKSTVINARFLSSELHAGGVLCVANNVSGFCREVDLMTCLGDQNPQEEFIRGHLNSNVRPHFWRRPNGPTTVKRRFIEPSRYSKLLEVCFIDDSPLEQEIAADIVERVQKISKDYDLVLVADFGHGMLTPPLVEALCASPKFLAVSAQTNSVNFGYNLINKYPRADYICIDEGEIRLNCHSKLGPLEGLMDEVTGQTRASVMTVTRAKNGSATWRKGEKVVYAPAFTAQALDPTGAGDAYLSVAALCAARGYSSDFLGFVGNCAGALAVRTLGNRESVQPAALNKFVTALLA